MRFAINLSARQATPALTILAVLTVVAKPSALAQRSGHSTVLPVRLTERRRGS
jgi:hypothetical protein